METEERRLWCELRLEVGGRGAPPEAAQVDEGRLPMDEELLCDVDELRPPNEKLDMSERPDDLEVAREDIEKDEEEEIEAFRECDR